MSPPSKPPIYLYKIVPSSSTLPEPLPAELPLSPLDVKDGFIHLSTSAQILGTLNRFFGNDSEVYLLRIPHDRVKDFLRWESPEGKEIEGPWAWEKETGYYPHIYDNTTDGDGCKLGKDEVKDLGTWIKGSGAWKPQDWPFSEDHPVA